MNAPQTEEQESVQKDYKAQNTALFALWLVISDSRACGLDFYLLSV